jgi:hypothetical protein
MVALSSGHDPVGVACHTIFYRLPRWPDVCNPNRNLNIPGVKV